MDLYKFIMPDGTKRVHKALDVFDFYNLIADDLKFFKKLYKFNYMENVWQEVTR